MNNKSTTTTVNTPIIHVLIDQDRPPSIIHIMYNHATVMQHNRGDFD